MPSGPSEGSASKQVESCCWRPQHDMPNGSQSWHQSGHPKQEAQLTLEYKPASAALTLERFRPMTSLPPVIFHVWLPQATARPGPGNHVSALIAQSECMLSSASGV